MLLTPSKHTDVIEWPGFHMCHVISSTALHNAIFCKNEPVFQVLLEQASPNLELKNADGHTVLWLSLQEVSRFMPHSTFT